MDNLILLHRQFRGPNLIVLAIFDVIWIPFMAALIKLGGLEAIELFGGLLIIGLGMNFWILNTRKLAESLKLLPLDVLKEVNEQCMTGLRFGNGILCANDCLVIVHNEVKVIMLKDVAMLTLYTMRKGIIFIEKRGNRGMFRAGTVNGAFRKVKGMGTFQEADRNMFWQALCSAWSKYTNADPIEL